MTKEIVVKAILQTLASGVLLGAKDAVKSAITDGYNQLKMLITSKFGDDSPVALALNDVEAKSDSEGRKQVLSEELTAVGADLDPQLASAAESLLSLLDRVSNSENHTQSATGSGIAQADRGSTAKVTMFPPSRRDDRIL